jgi:hypothetical protein
MVLIISIIVAVFFWFFFANVVQALQTALNPSLAEGNWMSTEHYNAFVLAANFVTYLWVFLVAIVIFILAYWVYIYNQRRIVGYE